MANAYVIDNNALQIRPYNLENGSYNLGSLEEIEELNTGDSKDGLRWVL